MVKEVMDFIAAYDSEVGAAIRQAVQESGADRVGKYRVGAGDDGDGYGAHQ